MKSLMKVSMKVSMKVMMAVMIPKEATCHVVDPAPPCPSRSGTMRQRRAR